MEQQKEKTPQEVFNLLKKVKEEIVKRYHENNKVFVDEKIKEKGLINHCAGLLSLLLIQSVNTDEKILNKEDYELINDELNYIFNSIDESGYNCKPFASDKLIIEKFKLKNIKDFVFSESLSWVISLMTLTNYLSSKSIIVISDDIQEKVKRNLKESLSKACDIAVDSGGWGFANECNSADLYFSNSVTEAFADFADYILGESEEEIGIAADEEMKRFLGEELITNIQNKRKKTAEWLINDYLEILNKGNYFNNKDNDENFLNLYNTYYIINMLILNNADILFSSKEKEIKGAIEMGIYFSRIYFQRAMETGEVWWNDPDKSAFIIKFPLYKEITSNGFKTIFKNFQDPNLVPMSLRSNVLYSFYISKGGDKKIDDLYSVILENKYADYYIWDSNEYNIFVTEKSIEALIDYYDYLCRYEESNPKEEKSTEVFQKQTFEDVLKNSVIEIIDKYLDEKKININSSILLEKNDYSPQINDFKMFNEILVNINEYMKEFAFNPNYKDKNNIEINYQLKMICEHLNDFLFYSFIKNINEELSDKQKINKNDKKIDEIKRIKKGALQSIATYSSSFNKTNISNFINSILETHNK